MDGSPWASGKSLAPAANPAMNPTNPHNENVSGSQNVGWFELTARELENMRKKHRKGLNWTFGTKLIVNELNGLGRGWPGYLVAKRKAEREGRSFDYPVGALLHSKEDKPEVGAVSMQTARAATLSKVSSKEDRSNAAALGRPERPDMAVQSNEAEKSRHNQALPERTHQTEHVSQAFEQRDFMEEPPSKRRKYIPGGPGGGGRFYLVDDNGEEETTFARPRPTAPVLQQPSQLRPQYDTGDAATASPTTAPTANSKSMTKEVTHGGPGRWRRGPRKIDAAPSATSAAGPLPTTNQTVHGILDGTSMFKKGPGKKKGGTGRGPGRWPKGSRKSDFSPGVTSAPGLSPAQIAEREKRNQARASGLKSSDHGRAIFRSETSIISSDLGPGTVKQSIETDFDVTPQEPDRFHTHGHGSMSHEPVGKETFRRIGRPKGSKNKDIAPAVNLGDGSRQRRFKKPEYNLKKLTQKFVEPQRPPKELSPTPREIYKTLQPRFIAFCCEWKGCKAELHDIATLRKHVNNVHGRRETHVCRWGKCGDAPPTFESKEDLVAHMEGRHLVPFTWHLGDGYVGGMGIKAADQENLPSYLFDRDGFQVTPSIRDQKVEDFYTWRRNRERLKEILMQRDANAPLEDEDGELIMPPR